MWFSIVSSIESPGFIYLVIANLRKMLQSLLDHLVTLCSTYDTLDYTANRNEDPAIKKLPTLFLVWSYISFVERCFNVGDGLLNGSSGSI